MHKQTDSEHFDMLPFISILMCTLGCLLYVTLIISSLCIGPGAGEGWIPIYDKGMPHKQPVLFEWDGKVVTIHGDGGRTKRVPWKPETFTITLPGGQVLALTGDDSPSSSPLSEAITELDRKRETHYALFAVRPSGFSSFGGLVGRFRAKNIDVGYEPIPDGRPVRLLKGVGR